MRQHGEGVAGAPRADGEGKGSPTVSSNPVRVAAATHLFALRHFQRASGATSLCAATQGVVGGGRVRRWTTVTQGQRWSRAARGAPSGRAHPGGTHPAEIACADARAAALRGAAGAASIVSRNWAKRFESIQVQSDAEEAGTNSASMHGARLHVPGSSAAGWSRAACTGAERRDTYPEIKSTRFHGRVASAGVLYATDQRTASTEDSDHHTSLQV